MVRQAFIRGKYLDQDLGRGVLGVAKLGGVVDSLGTLVASSGASRLGMSGMGVSGGMLFLVWMFLTL